jgi:cytidylate kinase
MSRIIVAIDGPSGAGKGTVARAVARHLGYHHLDTGAMYRAIGWKAIATGTSLTDEEAVRQLAERARLAATDGVITIDGHDISRAIRTPEIDRAATLVARLPHVREVLVERQRAEAARGGFIVEGRDIGTVVFPHAAVKVYLDATPEERARRRAADPAHTGSGAGLAEVAQAIVARDEQDRTRQASPLIKAPDAETIDTTGRAIDDVVRNVLGIVRKRLTTMGEEAGLKAGLTD